MSEEGLGVGAISEIATPNHVPYTTENYIVEPVQPSIPSNLPSIIPDLTVRPRFITPFPTLSKNSHELANRHPSQQPQCGKSPQAAPLKVRPTAEPRADLGLARSTQPSTFSQFPKLPTEIRLMTWKAALPGPRIVEINIGKLKHNLEDREVEDANTEESTNSIWERFLRFDDQEVEEVRSMEGEPALDQKAVDGARPTEIETAPAEAPVFLGIRSSCVPPAVLFVNREAHEVAAKYFEKAFPYEVALAQTWFDFDLDTLYIRYDKFNN